MEALKDMMSKTGSLRVVLLCFPDMELLDVFGPLELFGTANVIRRNAFQIFTTGHDDGKQVTPAGGPPMQTDLAMNDAMGAIDLLFIPGGPGTVPLEENEEYLAFVKQCATQATAVMTVCTGSMLLARTGLLDGIHATTNKLDFQDAQANTPKCLWQSSARWVISGKFFTSSGVSAGTDMAAHLIESICGSKVYRRVLHSAEYLPNSDALKDPFSIEASQGKSFEPLPTNKLGKTLEVALVVYDQFEMLDTFGPLEFFELTNRNFRDSGSTRAFNVTMYSEASSAQCFQGPTFKTKTFDELDASGRFDIVMVPGGVGTVRELYNPAMLTTLARLIANSERVMTVCSGSAIVAATGAMDGHRATSNKHSFRLMSAYGPRVTWVTRARFVADGKFYTSSGVSAGCDLSLHVIAEIFGEDAARAAARRAEYTWHADSDDDPFSGDVGADSVMGRLAVMATQALLATLFTVGFALGFKMQITKLLL